MAAVVSAMVSEVSAVVLGVGVTEASTELGCTRMEALGLSPDVDPLDGSRIGLLTFGEANNAAALAVTELAGVVSLVHGHGAADDGVGAAQVDEQIPSTVDSCIVGVSFNLFNVTNAALVDVLV